MKAHFYRFVGKPSAGYETNHVYELDMWIQSWNGQPHLWIEDVKGDGVACPYQSMDTFLENWVRL